jgi:hypothetical protein
MIISYDSETVLIGPGERPPRLVCGTFAEVGPAPVGTLLDANDTVALLHDLLDDRAIRITGANLAFDILVSARADPALLPKWIDAAENDRLHDVLLRQALIDLSRDQFQHTYNLDGLSRRLLHYALDKSDDSFRLRYGELIGLPVAQYPAEAVKYAIADVEATARIHYLQELDNEVGSKYFPGLKPLENESFQVAASIWLRDASNNGLLIAADRVNVLAEHYEKRAADLKEILVERGLVRQPKVCRNMEKWKALPKEVRDGIDWKSGPKEWVDAGVLRIEQSRDTKAVSVAVADALRAQGREPRRTDAYKKGVSGPYDCISTDMEACSLCDDPVIQAYAEYSSVAKSLGTDIPMLLAAATEGGRIHTYFTVIQATGRTSSSGPNIQNWGRKGDTRNCVIAPDGYVLVETDFSALELRCFAQICLWLFGESKMAGVLNRPAPFDDVHSMGVSSLTGMPFEEVLKRKKEPEIDNKRTALKGAIFGKLGGLGAETFVTYAKQNYGLTLTKDESSQLLQDIQRAWEEIKRFLNWVNSKARDGSAFDIVQFASHRLRAGCTYCSAANSPFQGLGSDVAKLAGWYVWKETVTPGTVLYGAKIVNFVHDSLILEAPKDRAKEMMERQEFLMCKAEKEFLPDIKPGVESKIMESWRK